MKEHRPHLPAGQHRLVLKKILLSLVALGAAASIAGLGTCATFTGTTSASRHVLTLGAAGGSTNSLAVNANGLVPGDTVQRTFDLINNGNENLASVTATTTANPSTLLDTDARNGLQIAIERCSVAWTEAGPPYTYTCSGSTSTVVTSRAIIGSNVSMSNLTVMTAGSTDHLRLTLTLPTSATRSTQGLTSTISYAFNGAQHSATNQ